MSYTLVNVQPTIRIIAVLLSIVGLAVSILFWSGQNTYRYQHYHAATSIEREPITLSSLPDPVETQTVSRTATLSHALYLPSLFYPQQTSPIFAYDFPIWFHNNAPAKHEVGLFRHTFTISQSFIQSDLVLFADTRYEVWIDGVWIGRGPARFSRHTREYDTYKIGPLQTGTHTIAVLVQWAPGTRRTESVTPFLMGHMLGQTAEGSVLIAGTGPWWKATRSSAWQQDAAPVHTWGLIGPTELLDLRLLPQDWMMPTFADDNWQPAVMKEIPRATNLPRSIPRLATVPVKAIVQEIGKLSPDSLVGEIPLTVSQPYTLSLNVAMPSPLRIETLQMSTTIELEDETNTSNHITPLLNVAVDGIPIAMHHTEGSPPDVVNGVTNVATGTHVLSFTSTISHIWPIVLQSVLTETVPLSVTQNTHAGRRLLLTQPISQSTAVLGDITHPSNLTFLDPPSYVVLDLGRVVQGRFSAMVEGNAGTIIDIGWDERLWGNRRPLPYPGSLHPQWNQTDSWVLDGNKRNISTIDTRSGRYILIAVWSDAPVTFTSLQVYEERYPVEQLGSFHSTNSRLNHIWQVGVDTIYSNMTDAYADPWRERGQWWGDAFVADHVNQVAFGDTQLLRRGLFFMAEAFDDGKPPALAPGNNGTMLLDYGMLWVQSLDDYVRLRNNDQAFVKHVYPVLQDFMTYLEGYENETTHLLDVPKGPWSQTALIDWAAVYSRYGQSTALNAIYYDTLLDAAARAEELKDTHQAQIWHNKAQVVKQSLNEYLYVPEQGRYLTSIVGDVVSSPSPQAQAWALTYGIVPEESQQVVADSLLELISADPSKPNVEIYGMFWVLEALGKTNRLAEAMDLIERYYGRLIDLGATTWWEGFNSYKSYKAALSHGWGGAPTWFLSSYVLGIQRTGANTWRIQPSLQSRESLSGSMPLAEGVLSVAWDYPSQDTKPIVLTMQAPTTSTGKIVVPFDDSSLTLVLNGEIVWRSDLVKVDDRVSFQDDGIHIALQGGHYVLEIHRSIAFAANSISSRVL